VASRKLLKTKANKVRTYQYTQVFTVYAGFASRHRDTARSRRRCDKGNAAKPNLTKKQLSLHLFMYLRINYGHTLTQFHSIQSHSHFYRTLGCLNGYVCII